MGWTKEYPPSLDPEAMGPLEIEKIVKIINVLKFIILQEGEA